MNHSAVHAPAVSAGIRNRIATLAMVMAPVVVLGALALSSSSTQVVAAAVDPQQRLASHLGVPAHRLSDLQAGEETLFDGRRLVTIKAIDSQSGEIVGVSLLGDRSVDRLATIAQAGAAWRSVHGALTPPVLDQLNSLRGDERLDVELWFVFDPPEPFDARGPDRPLPDGPPAELLLQREQMRAAEQARATTGDGDAILPPAEAARILAWAAAPAPASFEPQAVPEASPDTHAGNRIVIAQERIDASERELADSARRDAEHHEAVLSAMITTRQPLLQRLNEQPDIDLIHISDTVPAIRLHAGRTALARMARWPQVDGVYLVPDQEGTSMQMANRTINHHLVSDVGYTGAGVTVSVTEGGRVFGENPFLNVASYCRPNDPGSDHATIVAGYIGSTHPIHRGTAPGATLVSANCESNGTRIDWGSDNARVLNHSFWSESGATSSFNALDRRIDWVARFRSDIPIVSSGNAGNGCPLQQGYRTDFVTSPGKGYNAFTIGNFNNFRSATWFDDQMNACSSFGNPLGDGASGRHQKPELVAPGTSLYGTLVSTDPKAAIGCCFTGTSMSAPMVAGVVATLIQARPALDGRPEAIKPILMVSALHNIEGNSRLSDQDGAGALVSSAAIAIAERNHLDYRFVSGASDLPYTLYMLAKQGERVRAAIHWQANANVQFTNSSLPADLDLRVYSGDGTTLITSSVSTANPFEIVEFTAPATDLYQLRISQFGNWSGGGTFVGAAWWVGVDRLTSGTWQTASTPPPLGHHYDLRPEEAGVEHRWHGVSLRPASGNYNLELYNLGWFGEPQPRQLLTASTSAGNALDFIVSNAMHWPMHQHQFYRVRRVSGSGSYQLSASTYGSLIGANTRAVLGPYTLNSIQSLFLSNFVINARDMRRVRLIPAAGSNDDFGLALYRSYAGSSNSDTWTQPRSAAVAHGDNGGAGVGEALRYRNNGASDVLGLAVYNKTYNSSAEFYLQVTAGSLFNDGFENW